jgi:hypothetical protein
MKSRAPRHVRTPATLVKCHGTHTRARMARNCCFYGLLGKCFDLHGKHKAAYMEHTLQSFHVYCIRMRNTLSRTAWMPRSSEAFNSSTRSRNKSLDNSIGYLIRQNHSCYLNYASTNPNSCRAMARIVEVFPVPVSIKKTSSRGR